MPLEPNIRFSVLSGAALAPFLPALARLRITVFRDFPYLYDGDAAYEEAYLRIYVASARAAVVFAFHGDAVVGASTCLPLADETANVQAPFVANGIDVGDVFYFGESVVLPAYRGLGIGVRFFEAREAHAREFKGFKMAAFCAVRRPEDHPLRPPGFVPLDAFWRRRGFTRRPALVCKMSWLDLGEPVETEKELVFWTKML